MEQLQKEVFEIKTEFTQYKSETNRRLDEIIDGLKPQFTKAQITGFLLTFVSLMASIFIYIGGINTDVENLKEHTNNKTLHMPFEKKIEVFVPRIELDARLKNIEDTQEKMYNLLLERSK